MRLSQAKFARYAWFVLFYNLVAIVWGAFVRISFSGDGCGKGWPLCEGELIPTNATVHRLIEGSHRFSAELGGLLVVGLVIWAFRAFAKGDQVRKAALYAGVFTVVESLLGMELVLRHWVKYDDSVGRAVAMSAHLTNTLLLVGSLTLAAVCAGGRAPSIKLRGQGPLLWAIGLGGLCVIALGVSGAISALGHTVVPVDNVLQAAVSKGAHFLTRLQPLHPIIATSVGLYLLLLGGMLIHLRPSPGVKNAVQWMVVLFVFQFALGLLNIVLSAPASMQLIHLAVADACWIAFVIASARALDANAPRVEVDSEIEERPSTRLPVKELIKQYVALTKPRVISLLLFTTIAAMYAAHDRNHPFPSLWLVLAVAIGGYMAAGAANAINMVIDRDIDGTMKRTASRPTVTHEISAQDALMFGFALGVGSFTILWAAANLLSAMMAFAGLVFYVIVYTMLLKRRTWQNIVIGGAAGCFPPLVGWTAVTNQLNPLALILFAIIFAWTPVHFWALALLIKDDYAAAGVPMLPVVRGDRVTVIQICLYTVLTVVVSSLPFIQREASWLYLGGVMVLNALLVVRVLHLYRTAARPQASSLFHYSMLYLALLFLVIAVDRSAFTRQASDRKPKVVSASSQISRLAQCVVRPSRLNDGSEECPNYLGRA